MDRSVTFLQLEGIETYCMALILARHTPKVALTCSDLLLLLEGVYLKYAHRIQLPFFPVVTYGINVIRAESCKQSPKGREWLHAGIPL